MAARRHALIAAFETEVAADSTARKSGVDSGPPAPMGELQDCAQVAGGEPGGDAT